MIFNLVRNAVSNPTAPAPAAAYLTDSVLLLERIGCL